jgi:hypothetical protein
VNNFYFACKKALCCIKKVSMSCFILTNLFLNRKFLNVGSEKYREN